MIEPEKSFLTELLPWAPIIGAFGGALITGLVAFGINFVNKKSEERRHIRDLAMNTAFKYWQHHMENALENHKRTGKENVVSPLDSYVIHILKLFEIMTDKKINKDNIEAKLKEIYELEDIADKVIIESQ